MHDEHSKAVEAQAYGRVLGVRGKSAEAQIDFRYERSDPYAVLVTVTVTGQGPVVWLLARDLFFEGLCQPAGMCDATVIPGLVNRVAMLDLTLCNGSDSAVIELRVDDVAAFLHATDVVVKRGDEFRYIDIDGELSQLLAD
jgi:hypothetical protein